MKRFTIFTVTFIAVFALQLNAQVTLNLKVFLEGPFNGTNMNTGLNVQNLLPLTQPYNFAPWNYSGTEQVSSIPNPDIVDWILIELRETTGDASTATPDKMINRQVAFLKKDGTVVGLDGTSVVIYSGNVTSNLYVIIWQRNHLAIMTSGPITESGGVYSWDFTDQSSKAYHDGQEDIGGGKFGMIGGDCDASGWINILDKNENWSNEAGDAGYYSCDVNMDTQVNNLDKDEIWLPNKNIEVKLPEGLTFNCGDALIDLRDDQVYSTVQIGDQCWMAENLNIGTMITGSSNQIDNPTIEKYCYDNNTINCDTNGGLYQWNEMMEYTLVEGTQGICPAGWHLPSEDEWCVLTQFIDPTVDCNTIGYSGTDVGARMKSTSGWNGGGNGTNTSGFNGLPGGFHIPNANFANLGFYALFWSSTEYVSNESWDRDLPYNNNFIGRVGNDKNYGFSVRCIKDIPANQPPSIPSNLVPGNGAVTTPAAILSWSCTDPENNPLTYDLYLGGNPPPLYKSNLTENYYSIYGFADVAIHRYWKIVAHDNHNNSTESPINDFWSPGSSGEPLKLLYPEDNQQNVLLDPSGSIDLFFWWNKPIEEDEYEWYFYFGTSNPPPGGLMPQVLSSGLNAMSMPIWGYEHYYWSISFRDIYTNEILNSPVFTFSISYIPCPGTPTVTYSGQTYNTVQIGGQCWMHENLNIGTMIDSMDNQINNGIIEKYCYRNLESNCATYGGLYQWNEMMEYTEVTSQGICPPGWHVPSDMDWCILEMYADPNMYNCTGLGWRGTDVAEKLMADGPNYAGFSALEGGERMTTGFFGDKNNYGIYWTSTLSENYHYWTCWFWKNDNRVYRVGEWWPSGYSVRCLKD